MKLDEQFFGEESYREYLTSNFILIHAERKSEATKGLFKEFSVTGTPTVLVLDADGNEIDRLIGYGPPAEKFKAKVEEINQMKSEFALLKKACEEDPENIELLSKCVLHFYEMSAFPKMKDYGEKILALGHKAKDVEVDFKEGKVKAYELARYACIDGDFEKTKEFLKEFPDNAFTKDAYYELGEMIDSNPEAEKLFLKYLKKNPVNEALVKSYMYMCLKDGYEGDMEKALKHSLKLYDASPEVFTGKHRQRTATLAVKTENIDKISKIYGAEFGTTLMADTDANEMNGYAWYWAQNEKNLESALEVALKAVEVEPKDDNIWDTLSYVYWKMGKHEEAIKAEEKALELVGGVNEYYQKRIADIKASMES